MKKVITFLSLAFLLSIGLSNYTFAQPSDTAAAATEQTQTDEVTAPAETETDVVQAAETQSFHQVLKNKFIEGGPTWMTPILIVLILGLALCIERIIYLNMADVNSEKLLVKLEDDLKANGVSSAKELCKNTRGPVASILFQGLDRYNEGLEVVEKSVVSYGSVQMAKLERNLSWIALFIALAPSLGFLGTVIGMVGAFDSIEKAGDISPTIVAGGMKIALITTVFGLITAIILQVFYNYLLSKINSVVADMEDASISFMDILVRNKNAKN